MVPTAQVKSNKYRWKANFLEAARRSMWNPKFLPLLYNDLGVRRGMTVVDVGCGTGFFTRLVAQGMKGGGHVVGFDVNQKLLNHARQLSAGEHLGAIEYRKGDVYEIPLPEGYADLTVSHMLIHWLKEPVRALREMRRITRVGGKVATICIDADIYYDPNNPRLNELDAKLNEAFVRGAATVDGYDLEIARKLPAILQQAGFSNIRADGYASLDLTGDSRISKQERQERLRAYLDAAERTPERRKRNLRYALAGGMSAEEYKERLDLRLQRLKRWVNDPEVACNDMALSASIIVVASGEK